MNSQITTLSIQTPLITGECYLNPLSHQTTVLGFLKGIWEGIAATQCDVSLRKYNFYTDAVDRCCFKLAPTLRSGVELSNETWHLLGQGDNLRAIDFIHQKGGSFPKVTKRLSDKTTQELQKVAKEMGAVDPTQYSFKEFEPGGIWGAFFLDKGLVMSTDLVYAINGWSPSISIDQVRGVLAHEMAHSMLGHDEKRKKEEEEEVEKALWSGGRANYRETYNLMLNHEVEADIFATRISKYGRYLRDSVLGAIESEKEIKNNCGQKGFPPCADPRNPYPSPKQIDRLEYITDALCAQHPEKNRDICPDTLMQKIGNATCPILKIEDYFGLKRP
jgi:hypothetical protein